MLDVKQGAQVVAVVSFLDQRSSLFRHSAVLGNYGSDQGQRVDSGPRQGIHVCYL